MISCEEAAVICNKSQYHEAGWADKLRLKLHILFCSTCSSFSRKNKQLTGLFRRSGLRMLSEDDKEDLRQRIAHRL